MKNLDYTQINKERQDRFLLLHGNQKMIDSAKAFYSDNPVDFINHWCVTYDPRNAGTLIPTRMPFILFKRQVEFIGFLNSCLSDQENGTVEKCRDMGATWASAAFSVWMWLFKDGSSVGWGSRKEQLVDKLGDPDSIFEKIRIIIDNLPSFFKPNKFVERDHATYMRIVNPENHSTITGEAGDNIGRGGRKTIYFKDESSHYERPEKIEAALGDNTNVQIDISSVNGPTTVFQRKVDSGEHWKEDGNTPGAMRVFIFDWRDHPDKDQAWHNKRKSKAEKEGLLHLFYQEVDRDASSAVEGTLIKPAWIKAAIDAHIKLKFKPTGKVIAAFDVADEGQDKHAESIRKGILLKFCKDWPQGDTGEATQKAIFHANKLKATSFMYDSIGVGAGAKAETNRLKRNGILPERLKIIPWNAASAPLRKNARVIPGDKQSPKNKDFYANLKAQGWWQLRLRFEKTYKVIVKGDEYPLDELISLDGSLADLREIEKELSQPTYTNNGAGKILINKKPSGTKSPNKADSIMMAYWPITVKKVLI